MYICTYVFHTYILIYILPCIRKGKGDSNVFAFLQAFNANAHIDVQNNIRTIAQVNKDAIEFFAARQVCVYAYIQSYV